jgi:quercetin dioxygenase-like cupin family protein
VTGQGGSRPFHSGAGKGPALWHLGSLVTFKATGEETGGAMWVQEASGARGFASPVHRHSREDEAIYVLDGELSVYVDSQVFAGGPGSFLWAPRGLAHAFCVESEVARFLVWSTPAGFDQFFFATGRPARARTLPPPADGPPDVAALAAALARHGVEMLGPPPAPAGRP